MRHVKAALPIAVTLAIISDSHRGVMDSEN